MNWFTGSSPDSFQTFTVVVVKFLRTEAGEGEDSRVYGKVMLVNGDVKLNTRGKTEVVKVCKSEEERVGALKKYFGIVLTEEERLGIVGHVAELKGDGTVELTA